MKLTIVIATLLSLMIIGGILMPTNTDNAVAVAQSYATNVPPHRRATPYYGPTNIPPRVAPRGPGVGPNIPPHH